ncbi:hypothetical protein GQX74_004948 [Glossina fuscipes]|nr:hypothetical protein GQX74_004948 [Glossina fuscipes]
MDIEGVGANHVVMQSNQDCHVILTAAISFAERLRLLCVISSSPGKKTCLCSCFQLLELIDCIISSSWTTSYPQYFKGTGFAKPSIKDAVKETVKKEEPIDVLSK